jgi:HEPN domain-containing protein
MEEDRIEPDEAFAKNLMQDVLDLWINPEIERRRESGTLPDDFAVRRAQVIMNIDAHAPEVRFNEEIKALARARAARAIDAGEEVTEADLEGIEDIVLTDQDPNAGHLTMMLFKGHWIIAFDFRYNAGRVACTVGAAREFLDSAAYSALERNQMHAFAENLFGATELMAKGMLLLLPDEKIVKGKGHGLISSKYNWWGKMGNTDPRYVKLLNRLSNLRSTARYLQGDYSLDNYEGKEMLDTAEDMYKDLRNRAPERYANNNRS